MTALTFLVAIFIDVNPNHFYKNEDVSILAMLYEFPDGLPPVPNCIVLHTE